MNTKEERDKERYTHCQNIEDRDDLIFVYPNEFNKNPSGTADVMQEAMNVLKIITMLDPTTYFEQRVVVGYRHFDDKNGHKTHPIWNPNRISIPWPYLGHQDEPLDSLTHEFVHPLFHCSPLQKNNEKWKEPFCQFLRGPLKTVVGLNGDHWWQRLINNATKATNSDRNPAGQLVLKFYEDYKTTYGSKSISDSIRDIGAISTFVKSLFSRFENVSLSTYLTPCTNMKKK
jgi:hypothetical protein